ncbi:MAG TPA: twin-arginine translocase TatA/TatE family subunit [Candidatus Methylacidiphilales bacterium]|jgi:TatA/E family protein of Tat protein translocase|nr:twin-arginine translocase TatA/TatE family subunit [Candidatus Methylacidiphilales bacterium]
MHPIFAWLPHGADWIYIVLLALLIFGADKIPKLARGFGRSLGEFKKAKEDFEKEVNAAASEQDKKPAVDQPKVSGNLPEPVHPVPTNTATSVDELTKKS